MVKEDVACPTPLGGIFDKRDFESSIGHPFVSAKKEAKNRRSPMQRFMPPQHLPDSRDRLEAVYSE
ncbi:MAG: hypothetical protein AAF399_12030, partial [Bacteroidota bacterium]